MHVANRSNHDVDLDDGRVLAPGEHADNVESTDRLTTLIDAGLIADLDDQPRGEPADNSDGIRQAEIDAAEGHPVEAPVPAAPGIVSAPLAPPAAAEPVTPADTGGDDPHSADTGANEAQAATPADTAPATAEPAPPAAQPEPVPASSPSSTEPAADHLDDAAPAPAADQHLES